MFVSVVHSSSLKGRGGRGRSGCSRPQADTGRVHNFWTPTNLLSRIGLRAGIAEMIPWGALGMSSDSEVSRNCPGEHEKSPQVRTADRRPHPPALERLLAGYSRSLVGDDGAGRAARRSEGLLEALDDARASHSATLGTAIGLGHSVYKPGMTVVSLYVQIAYPGFDVDVPHGLASLGESRADLPWPWEESMTSVRKTSVRIPGRDGVNSVKDAQNHAGRRVSG